MHLTPWPSGHGSFNHITSPHVWRVALAMPWVSPSSPHRGIGYRLLALLVVLTCLSWTAPRHIAAAPPDDEAVSGHEVIKWNQLLRQILRIPGAQPPTISGGRSLAMLHIAIFDAVNSIERSFTPYFIKVRALQGASKQAAAAQAAHDVLVALYPPQQDLLDAALAESLDGLPPDRCDQGIAVGQAVASAIVDWRRTDGWDAPPPPYVLPPEPGFWQPTPPGFSPATFTHYPDVVPFATTDSRQFRPPPPPALTSAQYATDFNETKAIGRVDSPSRTDDQTLVARLWAAVGTPTGSADIYNNLARDAALAFAIDLVQTARLFVLLNVALHDGVQTSWTSKFDYGLWRPVTAIQHADEDANVFTDADPDWLPLLVTPPYPTYAGNAATIGAAAATVLARFFGTNVFQFEAHWEGTPGWTRTYPSFWAIADEQARSRIYGGIHFHFDTIAGQEIGTKIGHYLIENFMLPRSR
jgi:PAP2 superfamily